MAPRILIVDDNAELLRLLSTVFEQAGYEVLQAQRARAAVEKASAQRPDAAIVDVLLPDQMGFEVGAFLRQKAVPFILVSGVFKGGRHALDATGRHGAADYFEKPFEMQRLLARVAELVPGAQAQPAAPAGPSPDTEEHDVEVDPAARDEEQALDLTGRVRITEGSSRIAVTLEGENLRVDPKRPLPSIRVAPHSTTRPAVPPVIAPVAAPAPEAGGSSQSGRLADNFPQLVSAFYLARETGELEMQRGQVRKVVHFEGGTPVFASSNLATDRFGPFLVRIGKVTAEDYKAAAHVADRTARRAGDVLIEMGLLNESERMYYVGQQVKAIIYSLFAWEEGTWRLTFQRRARKEALKLDLHPANLIMRGVRKLYSPARLARLMPDDAMPIPAPDPSYLLSDVELDSWEALLLARVDGTRSVAHLVQIAGRSPEQVRGMLVGLMSLKIVETGPR